MMLWGIAGLGCLLLFVDVVVARSLQQLRQEQFGLKMEKCLKRVKNVLDINRQVSLPSKQAHSYEDKFTLANFMTNAMVGSHLNMLERIGLHNSTPSDKSTDASSPLQTVYQWLETSQVSLHVQILKSRRYVTSKERRVQVGSTETEYTAGGSSLGTFGKKTFTTVTDHYHNFTATVVIRAIRGASDIDSDGQMKLWSATLNPELIVSNHKQPDETTEEHQDVSITWLLQQYDISTGALTFGVNVSDVSTCHTPRRNAQVDAAVAFGESFSYWLSWVYRHVAGLNQHGSRRLYSLSSQDIFVPVLPILEAASRTNAHTSRDNGTDKDATEKVTLRRQGEDSMSLLALFLDEESRTFVAELERLANDNNSQSLGIISPEELPFAGVVCLTLHLNDVLAAYREGVQYLEDLLHEQVVQAIGREVSSEDFYEYMIFHHRKLFLPAYEPQPLSRAIRRSPQHSPEGYVSVVVQHAQQQSPQKLPEPLYTLTRSQRYDSSADTVERSRADADGIQQSQDSSVAADIDQAVVETAATTDQTVRFALSATTTIDLHGSRHLHAAVLHSFDEHNMATASAFQLQLVAQANQFSSFVLLLGRMTSDTTFDPQYAMIVRNKDEIMVPLDLEVLPTAQEFREAVSSISPQQRQFATAFRAMQLEHTLFAVLVVQIKPQLEAVLNLPPDSLTKEIALTQQLLSLLQEYDIPSDFLSYDEDAHVEGSVVTLSTKSKVERVRQHAQRLQEVIDGEKELELRAKKTLNEFEQRYGHSMFVCLVWCLIFVCILRLYCVFG